MRQNLFMVHLIEDTPGRPLVCELDVFMPRWSVVVVKLLLDFLDHLRVISAIHTNVTHTVPCWHPSYQRKNLRVTAGKADPLPSL